MKPSARLRSLDVMRGFIMILLAAESALLYDSLAKLEAGTTASALINQFFHHPWHGLRFWDLVQPAFMTMAGTAMYFSYRKRIQSGISWQQNGRHVLSRSLKLFLCGVALHCVYAGVLVWELWNVLTQLAVTTIIAYLVIEQTIKVQIVVSVALLVLTELLYRTVLIPGFDQPFVYGKNFGTWMDTVLMGKVNTDGWVAINFLPTAAHTIAGVTIGKVLTKNENRSRALATLLVAAVTCLIAGYSLDLFHITPIIKRISTSSFVLASLGWVILLFVLICWLVDVMKFDRYAWVITVVGMNAIFIYLFFETVGRQWLNGVVKIFSDGMLGRAGVSAHWQEVMAALAVLLVEWGICYWLYKRKIFFKL
jgi:predicted acyltransferase